MFTLLIVMVGLVVAGPWLTQQAARVVPRLLSGAAPVLAGRRLAGNPLVAVPLAVVDPSSVRRLGREGTGDED